jgi:hypothetical protein
MSCKTGINPLAAYTYNFLKIIKESKTVVLLFNLTYGINIIRQEKKFVTENLATNPCCSWIILVRETGLDQTTKNLECPDWFKI